MHTLRYCVVALLAFAGCSNQASLTAMEQQQQLKCQTEPPSAYGECLEQATEPYSTYERDHAPLPAENQATETEVEPADETIAAPVIGAPVEDRSVVQRPGR